MSNKEKAAPAVEVKEDTPVAVEVTTEVFSNDFEVVDNTEVTEVVEAAPEASETDLGNGFTAVSYV